MNVHSLPAKVRELVAPILESSPAVSIARMRGSLGGSSGEGYIVAVSDRIYLFSRTLGEYEYSIRELYYKGDIQLLAIQEEKFSLMLVATTGTGEELSMKFAKYQDENLLPIVEQWQQASGNVPAAAPSVQEAPAAPAAVSEGALSPYVAGVAVLIFVAAVDEDIDPAEEEYILRFAGGRSETFQAAYDYYSEHEYDELLAAMTEMDRQQKFCVLANAMDLAMADGVLHKSEQEVVAKFAQAADISENDITHIRDTLLVKNQVSVLIG